jgi:mannose-1-phosphate guanylyltransferase
MLPAMILAAGLGTRLRPLTEVRPKALVPVGDRPVLAHALDALRAAGVTSFTVNTCHLSEELGVFAESAGVAISAERELLGTAGGVARAGPLLGKGDVIIWNGDVVSDVDVEALVGAHRVHGAEATLAVRPRPAGEGNVGIDEGGRIVRLRREAFGPEVRGGEFLGVHVLGEGLRALLPPRGCLVGDVYLPALRRGATVRAVGHTGFWHDIGGLAAYLEANLAWLRARKATSWVGPGATIDVGALLELAVLGQGASAGGSGRITRSVVWPGARVEGPISDAVVIPGRVVRVQRELGTRD